MMDVLYPDLRGESSLAVALKLYASNLGLELEGLVDGFGNAQLSTERGVISIRLGAEQRLFLINIYESSICWATGSTEEMGLAVRAIASWQGGVTLDGFVSEFPFMKLGELARAFESGNVAEGQWELLLQSDFPSSCQPLLVQLHGYVRLRRLFPEISFGNIRFKASPPNDDSRVIVVRMRGTEYLMKEIGSELREYSLHSLDEVASRIIDYWALDH
jgi:hypothetical protein